ncbi:hypothetical protein E4U41_002342 [Claviceps citrina]|nr:hypothetical protein E4U41_002342 [Claviceps citrina]
MPLKDRISSPLEAGPSVLDGHHLPSYLTPALEHASSCLARKAIHLTLVAARRDYHVPTAAAAAGSSPRSLRSDSDSFSSSVSRSRRSFGTGPVTALKQLVRRGGGSRPGAESPRLGRGGVPGQLSAGASPSPPRMTPCCTSSSSTATTDHLGRWSSAPTPAGASSSGLRFLHAPDLSVRDRRTQRAVFTKTARRFDLVPLLGPAVSPLAYGLSGQLFTNSVVQHEVLFSSDGLTILSLDRLYSLKAALASYSRTGAPVRLEDAVDELRRYVLAGGSRARNTVARSHLCRAYDWLSVSLGAVADLDAMYRRAYGGPDQVGAITGLETAPAPDGHALGLQVGQDARLSPSQIGLAVTTFFDSSKSDPPSPPPRGPALAVETECATGPLVLRSKWGYGDEDEDEDDNDDSDSDSSYSVCNKGTHETTGPEQDKGGRQSTRLQDASPPPSPPPSSAMGSVPWRASSVDTRLGAEVTSPDGGPAQHEPMTPDGCGDISPVTRGEWGFLMVDESFAGARTVTVETC